MDVVLAIDGWKELSRIAAFVGEKDRDFETREGEHKTPRQAVPASWLGSSVFVRLSED